MELYFVFPCPVLFIPILPSDSILEVVFQNSFENFQMFSVMGFRILEKNVSSAKVACNSSENLMDITLL